MIGDDIEIKVVQIRGSGDQAVIRIGITAPRQVSVLRKEVFEEVLEANRQAAQPATQLPEGLLEAVKEKGPLDEESP